ncbi:MAG: PQQ-dependent sugar dehydrogenase [Planctomycetota bacterium]
MATVYDGAPGDCLACSLLLHAFAMHHFVIRLTSLSLILVLLASAVFSTSPDPSEPFSELDALPGSDFPSGSDSRPVWNVSRIQGSPEPPPPYVVERVFPELEFEQPVAMVDLPGRSRCLVLQRNGKVFTFENRPSVAEAQNSGDLRYLDEKLAAALDVTLDPDFEKNRRVYFVFKSQPWFRENASRIVRFELTDEESPVLDPASQLDIFSWPSGDHAGSTLRFGPDGMLYATMGDGSGPFPADILRTAQDLSDVRGSVIRIDVRESDSQQPYRVPTDNPFVDLEDARGEIFAFGLRNPWRMDFDSVTGELYVGDVGWERWEMIHRVRAGGNYGWSITEGPQPIHTDQPSGPGPIVAPELSLPHTESQSITGGMVIRGFGPRGLEGHYVFGDYVNGSIWSAKVSDGNANEDHSSDGEWKGGKLTDRTVIGVSPLAVISFARLDVDQDQRDDLLVLDYGGGIYRIAPNDAPDTSKTFPRRLSQTGLYQSTKDWTRSRGVIPWNPAAKMWRDGATGDRILAIPNGGTIQAVKRRRFWVFPKDTVLANTISRQLEGTESPQRIETQILHFDGIAWQPYSYRWNEEQTDAELVDGQGDERELRVSDERFGVRSMRHQFASRDQCRVCHHRNMAGGIGFMPENLLEPSGESETSQWEQLVKTGVVTGWTKPGIPLVDHEHESESLSERSRSYLSINCGHCHQRGGGGAAAVVLTNNTSLSGMNAVDQPASQGRFEIPAIHDGISASVIHSGDPTRSVLYYRMSTVGSGRMPHLGSDEVDPQGLDLIGRWIESLKASGPSEPSRIAGEASPASLDNGDPLADESESATVAALATQRKWIRQPGSVSRTEAAAALAADPTPVVRGLLEAFVPPEMRSPKIGSRPDEARLLALSGDAERGRKWFADSSTSQCRNCHIAAGVGKAVGPPLDGIGKRLSREELLTSLLRPSAKIDPQWVTHAALTLDGTSVVGLKVNDPVTSGDESDDLVTLLAADGKLVTLKQDDVEEWFIQKQSLMPTGLVDGMTEEELGDLLAYLQSL